MRTDTDIYLVEVESIAFWLPPSNALNYDYTEMLIKKFTINLLLNCYHMGW